MVILLVYDKGLSQRIASVISALVLIYEREESTSAVGLWLYHCSFVRHKRQV